MSAALAALRLPPLMDVKDFIAWPGDGIGTRYELVDGVLRAMAPASDVHNTIVIRLAIALDRLITKRRPGCRVVANPGIQPHVAAAWNLRIPDLGVTCSPAVAGAVMTPDPVLPVEVLSPANAADTRENVRAYATIPSVSEILVVHSARVAAEFLERDGSGAWPPDPLLLGPGATVRLDSIGGSFPIEEAYTGAPLVQP